VQKYNAASGDQKKTLLRDCLIMACELRGLKPRTIAQLTPCGSSVRSSYFATAGDEKALASSISTLA
jgi:hypothetical protein